MRLDDTSSLIAWAQDELDEIGADEYVIFDCPGQIELYSHVASMQTVRAAPP